MIMYYKVSLRWMFSKDSECFFFYFFLTNNAYCEMIFLLIALTLSDIYSHEFFPKYFVINWHETITPILQISLDLSLYQNALTYFLIKKGEIEIILLYLSGLYS